MEQRSQRFVPVSEVGETISAITVSPDRHIFAVAQKSKLEPSIHLYDLHTYRKRRKLTSPLFKNGMEFLSMSFSADGKFLIAQASAPDWLMFYFSWEKGKPLASVSSSTATDLPVHQVSINPFDSNEILVSGKSFASIYRYSEGILRPVHLNVPKLVFSIN